MAGSAFILPVLWLSVFSVLSTTSVPHERRCSPGGLLPVEDIEPMASRIEQRLAELGLSLPRPPRPIGNFAYGVEHDGLLYLSGTYGTAVNENDDDYLPIVGKVGAELSIADGYRSATLMAINHLAMAKAVVGDLDRIVRVIRLLGFVNAASGFRDAPKVLNGASDLLIQVFGEELGRHARSALYQHELAGNAPVAGELTLAVRP